jgi:transaldolase
MRLYLDSADIERLSPLFSWGAFAGVTTNPIILARAALTVEDAVQRLCNAQGGDVFVQVEGDIPDLLEEKIRKINALNPSQVMIKVPPTPVGLEVIHRLRDERIWTAATALFTGAQALLAANAGADILIPFFSRIEEASSNALEVVAEMQRLSTSRGGRPKVLVASLKSVDDVLAVARLGVWGATVPVEVAAEMIQSAGTEAALQRFSAANVVDEE